VSGIWHAPIDIGAWVMGVRHRFDRNMVDDMTIRSLVRSTMIRKTRDFADRYNWTHPSILATFGCQPPYQAAFKTLG